MHQKPVRRQTSYWNPAGPACAAYDSPNMTTNSLGILHGSAELSDQLATVRLPARELHESDTSLENEYQCAAVHCELAAESSDRQPPKPDLRQTSAGNAHTASSERVFARRD